MSESRQRASQRSLTLFAGVLLPATMTLLGDWNWYLPRSLGWLPKIGIGERPGAEPGARPTRA